MCKQFADLIESCTLGDTSVITKVNDEKLMKDLSQLVGNVLVLADDNGLLKLTEKMLVREMVRCSGKYQSSYARKGRNLQMCFDFQMETFPKLSLLKTSKNDKYFPEFIQNLTIFTNQPNSKKLKQVITNEMRTSIN